jgi:hypothetical protein
LQRLRQIERQFRLPDASAQLQLGSPDESELSAKIIGQYVDVVGSSVGKTAFKQPTDPLVRIHLGGIGREVFQMKARQSPTQLSDGCSAMDVAVVKQGDDVSAQMPQHMAKQQADVCLPYVVAGEHTVWRQAPRLRADRKPADHRDPIVSEPVTDQRSLSDRSPGFSDGGSELEAGFVDENQVGDQPLAVFFILFQFLLFHCWMACSLRSKARLSGFW